MRWSVNVGVLLWCVMIFSLYCCAFADRVTYALDRNWRFELDTDSLMCASQPINTTFPVDYDNIQCLGLNQQIGVLSYDDCAAACCLSGCQVFQWCPANSGCSSPNACWTGGIETCQSGSGWQSRGRPPPPLPQPGDKCNDSRCAVATDDSAWRLLNVPHDFVLEGNFTETADMAHGYLPFGIGWYRRHFDFPTKLSSLSPAAAIWIQFDAIQRVSSVWLNGVALGSHSSGYTPSRYYLNSSQLFDSNNILVVKADATAPDGWWYDGGGIYRHVWLTIVDTSGPYLGVDGFYVPSEVFGTISWSSQGVPTATVSIYPSVEIWTNISSAAFNIQVDVIDPKGQIVGTVVGQGQVSAGQVTVWSAPTISLATAELWHLVESPLVPALYQLSVVVSDISGTPVDSQIVRFGFRRTHWDAASGFYLNDIWMKIKGLANHQDFAGVGIAVPDHLQWYRIQKLKSMNANGWRTAHNAPNPALLDATDEIGFLVWDENHRNGQDSEAEILIRRDRNHPSIVIWSVCNEILCNTGSDAGSAADAKRLNALMHSLDPQGNRPVSANNNAWVYADTPLDVRGFDYQTSNYDSWFNSAPTIPAISSESSSAVGDRDEYATNATTGYVSGYDNIWASFGESAEQAWGGIGISNNQGIFTRSFMSGGWTWTGFDYKGEPTPFQWPNINSHFGIIDIAGFVKDRFYWYQAWNADQTQTPSVLHLFPHWNWQKDELDEDGNVDVWVYSNVDQVELFLNGESLGRQVMPQYSHVEWSVPYVPGQILAVGYEKGAAILASSRNTTGPAAALSMEIHDGFGSSLYAKCSDVALISVAVVDANGIRVPTASNSITFQVSGTAGAAIYLGGGNGDPSCHVSDLSSTRPAYHGLVLAVIQSGDVVGNARITAIADDPALGTAFIDIPVLAPQPGEQLSWCQQNYL